MLLKDNVTTLHETMCISIRLVIPRQRWRAYNVSFVEHQSADHDHPSIFAKHVMTPWVRRVTEVDATFATHVHLATLLCGNIGVDFATKHP